MKHRIKKRLLVIALVVALSGNTCLFADPYRDMLYSHIKQNRDQLALAMSALGMQQQLQALWGENVANAFGWYVQSAEFTNTLTDIFEPSFRQLVTEDELKQVTEWYNTSLVSDFRQVARTFMSNIANTANENYLYFLNDNIMRTEKAVKNAKKNKPTKIVTFSMPKNYRAETEKLMQNMGVSEVQGMMRQVIAPAILQQLPKLTDDDLQQPLVQDYLDNFIHEAILGMLYKTTPITKIQRTNQGMETLAYQHYRQATEQFTDHALMLSFEMMASFAYWLKVNKPAVAVQWNNALTSGK